MPGLRTTISSMNARQKAADILAHQRAKELANPATFGGSGRTPSDALRKRLGLPADSTPSPRTLAGNAPPTAGTIKRKKRKMA